MQDFILLETDLLNLRQYLKIENVLIQYCTEKCAFNCLKLRTTTKRKLDSVVLTTLFYLGFFWCPSYLLQYIHAPPVSVSILSTVFETAV